MGRTSQRDIQRLYLLHRECVRRNARYQRAYRTVQAIRNPENQAVKLDSLRQRWGLSSREEPPDPSDWPQADPETLLKGFGTSTPPLKAATAQVDPVESDAAMQGWELLRTALPHLSKQLKGFLLLVHLPEQPNPPWGIAAIDLRRPKEEILGALDNLVDEAWKRRPPTRQARGPMRGPLKKGFDYLRVYDLREKEKQRLKDIGTLMWPNQIDQDTEQKAGVYLAKARAMIAQPPLLHALTQQLQRRQKGRRRSWEDPVRRSPSAAGTPVWLTPVRLSNGEWV
ncbi:MAG: hypothetical protein OEY86_11725 [Nitrospira sp.]|nr:hypothetical protein [Nitrospira sp.]